MNQSVQSKFKYKRIPQASTLRKRRRRITPVNPLNIPEHDTPLVSPEVKGGWTTKESLIILSFILICIFSLMEYLFNRIWLASIPAFRVLSVIIFIMFVIILLAGIRYLIIDRKLIWMHEREGLILFITGGLITILIPLYSAVIGINPNEFLNNSFLALGFGIILLIIGAIIIAWLGGFFTIWFFGLVFYLVMSSHEAFIVYIYTHHYGPYDQYYSTLGVFIIIISALLFCYHELKFLYLGKLIKRATILRAKGRYIEAIKPLKRALKLYPRYATAWNNVGNMLFNLGHFHWALECYNRALAISPSYKIAKKNKAMLLQLKID
jgi:tetratricopeptide (TPR) repeat protein